MLKVTMNELITVFNNCFLLVAIDKIPFLPWLVTEIKFLSDLSTAEIWICLNPYSVSLLLLLLLLI